MSRMYDAAEPSVIDDKLLKSLTIEQGPRGEAGKIIEKEGLEFHEILELRLDFKNIQHMENLWQLKNIVRLQLDNNIISTINGLDQLIHLKWLDLSFNNITKIEGLEKLTKLQDLSLAHNLIKQVSGLENLKELQVLSLAHNQLHDLRSTVMYLRGIPSIQTLCLRGNEFSPSTPSHSCTREEEELSRKYQMYAVAFMPSLVYLDYKMILQEMRTLSMEVHSEEIVEVERNEKEQLAKQEEERVIEERKQQYSVAYVDGLDGSELYVALFEEDTEAERLALLPGETEKLQEYCREVTVISKGIVDIGLEEEKKRRRENELFDSAYKTALESNQQKSVHLVQEYEIEKTKLLNEHHTESLSEAISKLHHDLMSLEMELVDQLDEISKEFERNYTDMIGHLLESIQAKTTQLREYEKTHHETILEQSTQLLEAYSKGQMDEELPDGLRVLFADKDTLLSAINAAHDTHMLVIDNREDKIRGGAEKDKKTLLDSLSKKLNTRNRQRVIEISHYIDIQHEELEDWLGGTKEIQ